MQDLAHTFNVQVQITPGVVSDGVAIYAPAHPPPQQALFSYSGSAFGGDSAPTNGTCP